MNDTKQSRLSGSVVAMFAGAFGLVAAFALILEQIGAPQVHISVWMVCFGIGIYVFSGFYGNTMRHSEFLNAGKTERPGFVAMAVTAGAITGGALLTQSGEFLVSGTSFFSLFSGILAGLALMTILFAAGLARSSQASICSVLFPQRANRFFLVMSALIIVACSVCLLLAQLKLLTLFTGRYFGFGESSNILLVLIATSICVTLGGMQSLSIVRVLMFVAIAIAFFTPMIWISYEATGNPIPQLSFGVAALQPVVEIDAEMIRSGFANSGDVFDPTTQSNAHHPVDTVITLLVIALGMAALPHLLQHFFSVEKGRRARKAGLWSFWLVFGFLSAIPAAALFAKFNIYTSILGLQIAEIPNEVPWLFDLSGNGTTPLFSICGEAIRTTADITRACSKSAEEFIGIQDISINGDFLVIALGILADLPPIFTNLLLLAGLFCILSTVDGLLLVSANTITVDIYNRAVRPKSPPGIRLFMNRFFIVAIAALIFLVYPSVTLDADTLFMVAIVISCSALFPMLVCRLWTKNPGDTQLGLAMIAAFATSIGMLVMTELGPDLVSATGDETVLKLPGTSNAVTQYASGLAGAFVFVLFVLGHALVMGFFSRPRKKGVMGA